MIESEFMKITKQNYRKQNFNANIKLKGDIDLLGKLTNEVLPKTYPKAKRGDIEVFMPDYIFHKKQNDFIDSEAEQCGYGRNWFVRNAQLHGINTNLHETGDIYVFSGNDLHKFKIATTETTLEETQSRLEAFGFALSKPEHLRAVAFMTKQFEHFENLFNAFIKNNPSKSVNNISELLEELNKG